MTDQGRTGGTTTVTRTTTTHVVDGFYWERRRTGVVAPVVVGVLGLAALGVGQGLPIREKVEHDLTQRSQEALRSSGLGDVAVDFSGRDGVLRGTVASAQDAEKALATVRGLDGVRVVDSELDYPGKASSSSPSGLPSSGSGASVPVTGVNPPQIDATVRSGRITLSGVVPTESARKALVDAAAGVYGAEHVVDDLRIDPGVSDAGLSGFGELFRALGTGAEASADLTGGVITLNGTVADDAAMRAAATAAQAVVGDPAKVKATLTPVAPSPAASAPVAAPETPSASAAVPSVAVPSAAVPSVAVPPVAPAPAGDVASVQQQLSALPVITFASDRDILTADGRATVGKVAEVLKAHPGLIVGIEGYTDDRGDWDRNLLLSQNRAKRVLTTLKALGVNTDGFTSTGFGEEHAKVPNDTPEHMQINRRVEFLVRSA